MGDPGVPSVTPSGLKAVLLEAGVEVLSNPFTKAKMHDVDVFVGPLKALKNRNAAHVSKYHEP